jgi:hypothetical protein
VHFVGFHYQLANKSFENMAEFRYLGTTLTNQNCIDEEINNILNLRNACFCSVYSVKNKIYKFVTLPVVYVSIPEYSAEKYILDMRRRQLKETGKKKNRIMRVFTL